MCRRVGDDARESGWMKYVDIRLDLICLPCDGTQALLRREKIHSSVHLLYTEIMIVSYATVAPLYQQKRTMLRERCKHF
jgi:hypothetical protein